ncbi:MAG: argA [Deltaproteobacteria bacterium]|jgi:amino-acid N-acetyltransferase|nr:argA [Deltaproteobacteria bacterium]
MPEGHGFAAKQHPPFAHGPLFEGMMKRLQDSIAYSFATPADKDQIRRLLSGCGLPTLYIHRHLKFFIVAKAAEKIVGVIGLEAYGRAGLLRSLCVDQAYRGRGVAKMLNARMMAYAQMQGIDRLYMFTFDAEAFASKLGFHKIDKNRIPKSIRSTWQFRKLKFRPAVCMSKKMSL